MTADIGRADLAARIDHTVLGPTTTLEDVRRVIAEAERHGMNACVPPCYLSDVKTAATVATVIGFPHGQHAPGAKRDEAERAWADGADELDVVCNVGRLKAGEADAVRTELEAVTACVPVPVKVIIEAPLLTDAETRRACECAREAGAAFVKTATGFADGGATVADVTLMSEYLPVKASGGIGDYRTAVAMLEAGAERIGASAGVAILEGAPD